MRAEVVSMTADNLDMEAIRRGGDILKQGGLVAFPTETVYGLGGDALNPQASMKIYAAKGRPSDNPLIVHIAEFDKLAPIVAEVPEKAKILAEKYWPGPLTMILPKSDLVPQETTGGLDSVAVRFPSDRIAQELIKAAGGYVAAPSANTSGRPSPTTAQHVEEDLGEAIEMIIDGGQVGIGLESTIVDFTEDVPVVLRPGYISLEMLQETLGDVRMDKGLIAADSKVRPKAPGMKYRHYAPKADLAIVEGPEEAVVKKINELAAEAKVHGEQVGIIATDETKDRYPEGLVVSIGSRKEEETIAHHLYEVLRDFEELINLQLKESHPKSWFRAFFNMGLINYIEGGRRMLPCEAGTMNFFIDPYGEVYPCNGLEERYWKESMGNIRDSHDFMDIWTSEQAEKVRAKVRKCPKNCWMVGTASPVMHKYIKAPLGWALKNKLRSLQGKPACLDKKWYDVGQDPCQGDLREKF